MRRLPKRPELTAETTQKLAAETLAITSHASPKAEAERRYANARKTQWFAPVVQALKTIVGSGQRCMFCSGSEASDVEHYRPKSVFPELAMTWKNYLWSCTPCNRSKLSRFPPDTEPGGRFINPIDEDVWEFFFIDEFGFLTPLYDAQIDAPNERAVSTEDLLTLNREAIQESREIRIRDLKKQVADTLNLFKSGQITPAEIEAKIATWRQQPFQPDVADYFLDGPGKEEAPFCDLFEIGSP